MRGGVGIEVRLDGIDCPELAQAFGRKAKSFTSGLVFGKAVRLVGKGKDRYGRELAEVFLPDGRSLNRELVAAGYRLVVPQVLDRPDPGGAGADGPQGAPRALGRSRSGAAVGLPGEQSAAFGRGKLSPRETLCQTRVDQAAECVQATRRGSASTQRANNASETRPRTANASARPPAIGK